MGIDVTEIVTALITSMCSIVVALITTRRARQEEDPKKKRNRGRRIFGFALIGGTMGLLGAMLFDQASRPDPRTITHEPQTIELDTGNSKIEWNGTLLGVKKHVGTLNIVEGSFKVDKGKLLNGSFEIDLTTVEPSSDTSGGNKLLGHLMSEDFFDAATYPSARFEITRTLGDSAIGQLTVRGVTNSATLSEISTSMNGDSMQIRGKLVFDRLKYGVAWDSDVRDATIGQEVELSIELMGKSN